MTVESAADLAGMFDPADFAVTATYTPRASRGLGAPVTVNVILSAMFDATGFPGRVTSGRSCSIAAASLPYPPMRQDSVSVGAESYTVASAEADVELAVYNLVLDRV